MAVTHAVRGDAPGIAAARMQDVDVVLDLGPGICPQDYVKPYVHICVDAHRPYLERLKRESADDPRYVLMNAPWDQVIGILPDKSVDTVFALDFIEHLEKADGLRMLREAERVARVQIVVYTPLGFYPQSYDDPHKPDRWGMDGGYWQTHRSGWVPEDFGEAWDCVVCSDCIVLDQDNRPMDRPMGALWAFRTLSPLSARRYHAVKDPSVWAYAKGLLEQGLPRAVFTRLKSAWGFVLRTAGRA
jgi:Methyltransferase domain